MCGFAGFIGSSGPAATRESAVRAMIEAIRHRGPDDSGTWVDENSGLALGHRRLSIIDLSPAGHQPMISAPGRFVIAFNGEIYNFEELRCQLTKANAAPDWRGHSDTEVLLAAIEAWGIAPALQRCAGMFAFALFDRETGQLTLARDRLGEKPLYYGVSNGVLLFGSDLAALKRHPLWQGEVDRDSLALLLRYNNVPAPFSIYKGLRKVEPGTIVAFARGSFEATVTRYWSAADVIDAGARTPFEPRYGGRGWPRWARRFISHHASFGRSRFTTNFTLDFGPSQRSASHDDFAVRSRHQQGETRRVFDS